MSQQHSSIFRKRVVVPFLVSLTVACGGAGSGLPGEGDLAADGTGTRLASGGPNNILSITASGQTGPHSATRAIDGNLSTRWSSAGPNAWIQADLGELRELEAFDIAWYRGQKLVYTFRISTSHDGQTFQQVFSGTSTGRTATLERYTFARTSARFVRVDVLRNSSNGSADIAELSAPVLPPADTGGDAGEGTNGDTGCTSSLAPAPIMGVTASAHDGNVPANVLDNDFATRWSCSGKGCWIRADLGALKQVGAVNLAWYRGDTRASSYVVAVSADGASYTDVHSGTSALDLDLQRVSFPAHSARYVRVTVNGNTSNDWASITELRAEANTCTDGTTEPAPTEPAPTEPAPTEPAPTEPAPTEPTPTEPAPTEPAPTEPAPTEPAPTRDVFGVTMLYPTKAGGETWSLSATPSTDKRFNPQDTITQNSDGSWKMKSTKVRMSVYTSTGYSSSAIATYNRDVLTQKGYMQAPNDWKNVEMTGFVKVNATNDSSDNFSWYARGGRHTDSLACEGSSYKGGLHYDGRTRWQKESWHVSYDQASYRNTTSALRGRWVGFKAVMRNITQNDKPAVKLELWLNDNADKVTWVKVNEMIDDGSWGGDASQCGGSVDAMPITWGGPTAVFRWDSATDVDFKWLSVREIQ